VPGFAEVPDAAVGVACLLQPAKTSIETKIAIFFIVAHYMPLGGCSRAKEVRITPSSFTRRFSGDRAVCPIG